MLVGVGLAFVTGVAVSSGCATSDQMLEQKRREEAGNAGQRCRPGIEEDCYSGPVGTLGRGACRAGRMKCADDGSLTECIGEVPPVQELCNGVDDDCDGIVDNQFERDGALCFYEGAKGACRTQGRWHCAPDGKSSQCDATIVKPVDETCDGVDQDCDGQTDEDSVPEADRKCTTGKLGVCEPGSNQCVNARVKCVQDVQQGPEICNGLDDDCDGKKDDDCVQPGKSG